MRDTQQDTNESGFTLNDVIFILFKHKWKLLICVVAGLISAACVYLTSPVLYESQAKLLVRYVVDRTIDSQDSLKSGNGFGENFINAEQEILSSWDLAAQVADAITVKKLLGDAAGAGASKFDGAQVVLSGLNVTSAKGSTVLVVSYRNRDPELATKVLEELVTRYFAKHLEVHRSAGAFDFVTQQTDQVKARLNQIDDELKKLKAKSGIISWADTTANFKSRSAKAQQELDTAEAERAQLQAGVRELEKWVTGASTNLSANPASQPSSSELESYKDTVERLKQLRQKESDLLSKYTAENQIVKLTQELITDLEKKRLEFEKKYEGLNASLLATTSNQNAKADLNMERTRLAQVEARTEMLKGQLKSINDQATQLSDVGTQIAQLERTKEVEEANLKYLQGSLERARVDEALDPSKMPNISIVQKPSPAFRATTNQKKLVLALAAGGALFGLALIWLMEMLFDRTVKRASEMEGHLQVPVLLAIPDVSRDIAKNGNGRPRKPKGGAEDSTGLEPLNHAEKAPWEIGHFIRPFSDEIRDRLILYFKLNNMTHKPKLVAVTGMSGGEGTSTLASGLAAALSETGDGKVLLVDMNSTNTEIHPFFNGRPNCSILEALQGAKGIESAADNLYLASVSTNTNTPVKIIPKRFYDLVPQFKASEFDYIIFDMPPVDQSSATLAMAGSMDKVLLVVEAEKAQRESVKRAYSDLVAARADVSAVLNKTHSYVPKWLGSGN